MASHLVLRAGHYHFRLTIPADLRHLLSQREIKASLGTGNKRLARRKAQDIASGIWRLFDCFRRAELSDLTKEQIQALVKEFLQYKLEGDEEIRTSVEWGNPELEDRFVADYKAALAKSSYAEVEDEVEHFLDHFSLEVEKGSYTHNLIARELLKANIDLYTLTGMRVRGEVDQERDYLKKIGLESPFAPAVPAVASSETPSALSPAPAHKVGPKLKETIDKYLASAPIKDRSRKQYSDNLKTLIEIVGDIELAQINHETARRYRDILYRLPVHRNKKKEYRNKSIAELLEMNITEPLSKRTVESKIITASAFSKWCIDEGYLETNYFANKAPKGVKQKRSTRDRYTEEELQQIFDCEEYVNDTFKKSYQFWSIPLALYTGARQSEIGGLLVKDVFQRDGIWCIGINEVGQGKSIKTDAGMRIVPLHPVLINQLKFVEYVQRLRAKGEAQVFPDLNIKNGAWGQKISEWFSKFKKKTGIKLGSNGRQKDFHAFRKTFLTQCKFQGVKTELAEQCVGHAGKSMSYDYYADDYPIKILFEEIMLKLSFEINLKRLTCSKWISP